MASFKLSTPLTTRSYDPTSPWRECHPSATPGFTAIQRRIARHCIVAGEKPLYRFFTNGVDPHCAITHFKEHMVKAIYAFIDQSAPNLSDPLDIANTHGDQVEARHPSGC
jgi:hypothetical protein